LKGDWFAAKAIGEGKIGRGFLHGARHRNPMDVSVSRPFLIGSYDRSWDIAAISGMVA
jgi:hypothetical protein